jgi:hypothetical protein
MLLVASCAPPPPASVVPETHKAIPTSAAALPRPGAYVVGSGPSETLVPMNIATNTLGVPIPVPFPSNILSNHMIAIDSDGKTAYLATSSGVLPIDLTTNTFGTTTPLDGGTWGIAITPHGKTAYAFGINTVDSGAGSNGPGVLIPIDLTSSTRGNRIPVGGPIRDVVIAPDGKTAYVATGLPGMPYAPSQGGFPTYAGAIVPVDIGTNMPGNPIPIPVTEPVMYPVATAITPDGKTAYVVVSPNGQYGGAVLSLDLTTRVWGIPLAIPSFNTPDESGTYVTPGAIAITPDGKTAVIVALDGTGLLAIQVNLASNAARTPIPITTTRYGGSDSGFIAIAPDNKTAYVTTATDLTYATPGGGAVVPIDLAANSAGTPIVMTGSHPTAIITAPRP